MRAARRILTSLAVVAAMVIPAAAILGQAQVASAAPGPTSCGGTIASPDSLAAGTYSTVTVTGICAVDVGQVVVTGDVNVQSGAALAAVFSQDAATPGSGSSGITVGGNLNVASGAALILGCESSAFPCQDNGAVNSSDTVQGSINANGAMEVLVHNDTIGNDVVDTNGGPGVTCNPAANPFAALGGPAYGVYEDNTIGGNLRVTGLKSCWFGAERNTIGGSATYANNTLFLTDASELLSNTISGNFLCTGNSPAPHYGDTVAGMANVLGGFGTGQCAFGVTQLSSSGQAPISVPSAKPQGYWMVAADGGIFSFGVPFFGSQSGKAGVQPIAGMAAVAGGQGGYNLAENTGGVFAQGPRASDCTGVNGVSLNKPIVGIATAPGGNGCWLAASDGGVFTFGSNAKFMGSAGALPLNKPIVGIAATPNNDGYDLVASDGGIFTYGPGAQFYGSMGGKPLNQPIVGMAVDPATGGYWMVAKDGGVFAFNAPFLGSMGGKPLNKPIVGIAAAPTGDGYYLVASDGGIFTFGTGAHFQGSTGNLQLVQPVVGMSLG